MPVCSNGHDSTWDDYCSECGVAIGGASVAPTASASGPDAAAPDASATASPSPATPAANPPASTSPTCPNCADPHAVDDVFCENCGYDFLSGTLPDATAPAPAAGVTAASSTGDVTVATVRFDRAHMERMVDEGELKYTGPEDFSHELTLTGVKVLVGRMSRSRGVYPEIDVSEITEDPAVSSRHCMLMRTADGTWTVNDLGSTNGTYLGDADDPLEPGIETPLALDTPIFVGAWTSITLSLDE